MGLPIIDEIWSGLRWVIDFFMDKTPKAIKIIIFLLFLLFLGNVLAWMLHIVGIHCNSENQVMKNDAFDISSNVKILYWVASGKLDTPSVSLEEAHPWTDTITGQNELRTCTWILKFNSSTNKYENCEEIGETGCKYYYRSGSKCYNCTDLDIGYIKKDSFPYFYHVGTVCGDNAKRLSDAGLIRRNILCEPLCNIPEHYAWDVNNGTFYCQDSNYCGINATKEPDSRVDQEIKNAGGVPLYNTKDDESINKFIKIKCENQDYTPKITMFNINIFDYKIWVILIIIYLMFMFLTYLPLRQKG